MGVKPCLATLFQNTKGGFSMEIMGKGFMIVPVIIFVLGIVVSAVTSTIGVERIKEKK
jgi:hypothetical protein